MGGFGLDSARTQRWYALFIVLVLLLFYGLSFYLRSSLCHSIYCICSCLCAVTPGSVVSTILVASCYFFYHLTNEGLTFLLLQHGVGTGSTSRVATFGSLWGLVAAAVVVLSFSINQQSVAYIVIVVCPSLCLSPSLCLPVSLSLGLCLCFS